LILVDDEDKTLKPLLPCILRNILEYPLTEFARVGRLCEAFGFSLKQGALDSSHGMISPWVRVSRPVTPEG
jgi:hypothetical protein